VKLFTIFVQMKNPMNKDHSTNPVPDPHPMNYIPPRITILEIAMEKGFAGSSGISGVSDWESTGW
jgi:hypothetical protein